MTHLWVDPVNGLDTRSGASRVSALRSLAAAWRLVPQGLFTTTGYHIHITAGTVSSAPVYWEARHATHRFPLIIEAADGPGTAQVRGRL